MLTYITFTLQHCWIIYLMKLLRTWRWHNSLQFLFLTTTVLFVLRTTQRLWIASRLACACVWFRMRVVYFAFSCSRFVQPLHLSRQWVFTTGRASYLFIASVTVQCRCGYDNSSNSSTSPALLSADTLSCPFPLPVQSTLLCQGILSYWVINRY